MGSTVNAVIYVETVWLPTKLFFNRNQYILRAVKF